MTQDDRMETITDPAQIRATSDERGCCDCRTFDQHERECILPDERTTPAPVGAAVALDLDAARAMLNAANTIKATGGAVEIGGVRIEPCDEYGSTVTTARAESAEAEVGTLRDTLARRTDSHTQLVRENETLRAKVAAVEAIHGRTHWCFGGDDPDDLRDNIVFEPNTEWWPCPTFAALATTGEGQ